jgi:hypothetical protein
MKFWGKFIAQQYINNIIILDNSILIGYDKDKDKNVCKFGILFC